MKMHARALRAIALNLRCIDRVFCQRFTWLRAPTLRVPALPHACRPRFFSEQSEFELDADAEAPSAANRVDPDGTASNNVLKKPREIINTVNSMRIDAVGVFASSPS